jgi:hypothetical protein
MQRKVETLRSYIQRWSIIKNSAEDVSDERALDAFSAGLRRSELIEIASRFADGEDAYNNKRARSPEVDRANRKRCRSRNEDGHIRCNQVAAGYKRGDEEGNKSREYQDKSSRIRDKPKYSDPSAEDLLHGPCRIHYAYLDGKSFQSPDERLQDVPKTTRCNGIEPVSTSRNHTTGQHNHRSRVSNTK